MQRKSISKAKDLNDQPNVKTFYSTHKKTTVLQKQLLKLLELTCCNETSVSILLVLFTYNRVGIFLVFSLMVALNDSLPFLVFFTSVVPQSHSLRQSSVIVQGEEGVYPVKTL